MGWLAVNDPEKGRFLIHGGSLENYQSFFYLNPERNFGFIFLMNQGGLLPTIQGFNTIRNGFIKIVNGEQPESGPGSLPVIVVSGIFFFLLGIEIFRTIRLKTWQFRTKQKKRLKRWMGMSFEFIWSGFLFLGLIPFMNILMGDKADWSMIYGLIPELFYLLLVSICLGFFRGFFKIWILIKDKVAVQ